VQKSTPAPLFYKSRNVFLPSRGKVKIWWELEAHGLTDTNQKTQTQEASRYQRQKRSIPRRRGNNPPFYPPNPLSYVSSLIRFCSVP